MHSAVRARWAKAVSMVAATAGVAATVMTAAASAHPARASAAPAVKRFDMAGYVIDAKYTQGRNTGNTFEQTYTAKTAHGVPMAGPDVGVKFPVVDYVAMAIGHHELYVTWIYKKALVDVFVMNFATHKVWDYAPGSLHPESIGTITVKKAGHPV